jgi:hypothetical protein
MHQVVLHGFRQVESYQNPAIAHIQFAQHAQIPASDGSPERLNLETTTRIVVVSVYDHFDLRSNRLSSLASPLGKLVSAS